MHAALSTRKYNVLDTWGMGQGGSIPSVPFTLPRNNHLQAPISIFPKNLPHTHTPHDTAHTPRRQPAPNGSGGTRRSLPHNPALTPHILVHSLAAALVGTPSHALVDFLEERDGVLDVAVQVCILMESKGLNPGFHFIDAKVGSPGAFKLWVRSTGFANLYTAPP
jgi:hypothetical protein